MATIGTIEFRNLSETGFIPRNWEAPYSDAVVWDEEEEDLEADGIWRAHFSGGATNYPYVMMDAAGLNWIHNHFGYCELDLADRPETRILCETVEEAMWVATLPR